MVKDDGLDPQGGKAYSRYERVRIEKVWKETLEKEKNLHHEAQRLAGPRTIVMNLANASAAGGLHNLKHSHNRLEIITEKVEKQSPQERMSMEGFDEASFEVNAIRHQQKVPTQKWDLPLTSTQELGWFTSNPARAEHLRQQQLAKQRLKAQAGRERDEKAATLPNGFDARQLGWGSSSPVSPSSSSLPPFGASPTGLMSSRSAPCLAATTGFLTHLPTSSAPPTELAHMNPARFRKPRKTCAVTQYADVYVATMNCGPFASNPNDPHRLKTKLGTIAPDWK